MSEAELIALYDQIGANVLQRARAFIAAVPGGTDFNEAERGLLDAAIRSGYVATVMELSDRGLVDVIPDEMKP